jgi:hypothetical protein
MSTQFQVYVQLKKYNSSNFAEIYADYDYVRKTLIHLMNDIYFNNYIVNELKITKADKTYLRLYTDDLSVKQAIDKINFITNM